jgi:CRP/FNR family transcriptional regulator, cyclic AMP receptor protein
LGHPPTYSPGIKIRIFEKDPDLLVGVGPVQADTLRQTVVVSGERLDRGPWEPSRRADDGSPHLGLLIVDGSLTRWVNAGARPCAELLGAGDVVKPWLEDGACTFPCDVTWVAEEETTLAELGLDFIEQVRSAPQVLAGLIDRATARVQRIAATEAIATRPGIEERVMLVLWQLANRWGRVAPAGVIVPLPITHRLMAALVGASRPTVSTAVAALMRAGVLARREDQSWVLRGSPPSSFLGANGGAAAAIAASLRTREAPS